MSAPAYFVVVEDDWHLHDARWRWGVSHVELTLLAGLDAATASIFPADRTHPLPYRRTWPDIWGAAGALVHKPHRRLIYFSSGELTSLEYRCAHLAVLHETWPKWTFAWAHDGLADMAAVVGAAVPMDKSLARLRTPDPDSAGALAVCNDTHQTSCYLALTVRDADGVLLAWPTSPSAALVGARLLDHLPPRHVACRTIDGLLPEYGLHVDVPRREVGLWTADTYPGLRQMLADLWPGWTVEFWDDRIEEQRIRCDTEDELPALDLGRGFDRIAQHYQQWAPRNSDTGLLLSLGLTQARRNAGLPQR